MKTHNTITKLIAITMALAALVAADLLGAGLLQPVNAQIGDGSVRFVSYASLGIVPGEMVRLNVANTEKSGTLSLSFSYYLAHMSNSSSSVPLYESEWIQVPPGEFRFSDVWRKDLNTEGERGTGRAEVILKITMIAPAGSDLENFPCSLEVIKDGVQDGDSVQTDSKYRLIILAAKRSKQLAPTGFKPGQSLRYTFIYPKEEGSQPVRVQAYVYDQTGRLLTQTDPVKLEPGQSYTATINHEDLPAEGDNGTERLQVRADIRVASVDGSVGRVKIPV